MEGHREEKETPRAAARRCSLRFGEEVMKEC